MTDLQRSPSAFSFLVHGHIRAALAVVALRFLRARWLYWPVAIFTAFIIYLYAVQPALRHLFA
jgi:hypothetical protein